jgi:cysteine desulfurase family protein (TIGR01976 family)
MIDPLKVRPHFPALQPRNGAAATVFFDNPAGTQIAAEALARMNDYLVMRNANHGGVFRASRESDAMVGDARAAAAAFLGAGGPREISFGQNMTSLTLHLSRSIAAGLKEGDEIVVTRLDHDANISPWLLVARDRGCTVRWVDFDPSDCSWSEEDLARQVTARTRLVAVGYASNATGTVNPVAAAAKIARQAGAWCFVDAVHYAPHGPIDVASIGCDFLVCSAYKFFGPHTGVLWGRPELMERLAAYKVRPAGDAAPDKWETGTQSFESIAGVLGALEYLAWVGSTFAAPRAGGMAVQLRAAMTEIQGYECGLSRAMRDGLSSIKGLRIHGITGAARMNDRVPTFAFTLAGVTPRRICEELDRRGISAWDGNYYAPEVTTRLGLEGKGGMVRVGAVHYTTPEEIQQLVGAVASLAR